MSTLSVAEQLGVSWESFIARIPDYEVLYTLGEHRAQLSQLLAEHPRLLSCRTVGHSRKGQPIEMCSVGHGSRSALLVAGVHANEPVGSMSLLFLLKQLLCDESLCAATDFTWHFINPIDPDGMLLNEGWFASGLDPKSYFRSFFRPALARQADYTFPLQVGPHSFAASPPENEAFRQAIDLVKPDFLYTFHNAEYGGVFFFTSAQAPELEIQLQSVPAKLSLALSTVGEPLLGLPPRAPGVFPMPTAKEFVARLVEAGEKNPWAHWPGGDSSTGYAAERYGTVCFSAEVPYWDDPRMVNLSRNSRSLAQVLQEVIQEAKAGQLILEKWSNTFIPENSRESELCYAVQEHIKTGPGKVARIEAAVDAGIFEQADLTESVAAQYGVSLRLALIRPLAMLQRLAEFEGCLPDSARSEIQAYIQAQLRAVGAAGFRRLPIRNLVAVQAISGLMAAYWASHRQPGTL